MMASLRRALHNAVSGLKTYDKLETQEEFYWDR